MIVEGDHTFAAPRETVWELLQDPEVLAKAIPGTKTLERTGPDQYVGKMRVGVGPVSGEFSMSVVLADKVPPESYSMQVEGKSPIGFTRGMAKVDLQEEDGGASTRMRYRADLQIGGKIAGLGQRLLDQVAKLMTQQALKALNKEIDSRIDAGESG